MNREAAALGVPVYSIFRGKLGVVDRHLAETGRLVLVDSADSVQRIIVLTKRERTNERQSTGRSALDAVVKGISAALNRNECIGDFQHLAHDIGGEIHAQCESDGRIGCV